MIRASTQTAPAVHPVSNDRPSIWGLDAPALHDAYWRSRGVQCIRRGKRSRLDHSAELFMLVEPGDLVLFNLAELTERLIWRKSLVTRLRVVQEGEESYSERVVSDEHDNVERIERRYRAPTQRTARVVLTARRRFARLWMAAATQRQAWQQVRALVPWSRLDHVRCRGTLFREGSAGEERQLIDGLVSIWPTPAQVIEGIEEAGQSVWMASGETIAEDAVVAGPVWIGRSAAPDPGACVIGPTWLPDGPASADAPVARARLRHIGEVELDEVKKPDGPQRAGAGYALAKRAFDVVMSAVVLVLALPLFGVVALCILIEDGRPVFYGHVRQSRGGREFRCWKFRTMQRNADKMAALVARKNSCDGPQVLIRDDPRVTRVGHILRRFQIDEFPQFWNVLLGHMSVVGPRPSPDVENQYCPAWREIRLSVRPGITGLWQTERTRADGKDFQEWIRYDIEYVQRASFRYDLYLCVRTAWVLLRGRPSDAAE